MNTTLFDGNSSILRATKKQLIQRSLYDVSVDVYYEDRRQSKKYRSALKLSNLNHDFIVLFWLQFIIVKWQTKLSTDLLSANC